MSQISNTLADQFARVWMQVREAVANWPDSEWRRSDHPTFVPVRLACHLVETVDWYTNLSPEGFEWNERWNGVSVEDGDVGALLDQEALLAYVDEVQRRVDAWLRGTSDEAWFGENAFPGTGADPLGRMIYLLRHCQHHIAEIDEELTRRGLSPAEWH